MSSGVSELKKQWEVLINKAKARCHRNSTSMRHNTNASKTRKADADATKTTREKSLRILAQELRNANHDAHKHKKQKARGDPVQRCVKAGCDNSSKDGVSFHRLPPYPDDPTADASLKTHITYLGKRWLRQEINDRCGLSRLNGEKDLQLCDCHPMEIQQKTITFEFGGKAVHQT